MVQLGVLQHQAGNYPHAVAMLAQAKELEPNHPLPLVRLAQILPPPGYDEAISLLRRAIKLCRLKKRKVPEFQLYGRLARSSLIHLYMLTGRHALAEKAAAKLLQSKLASAEDLTNLAAVRRHAGDADGSLALLREAVSDSLKALEKDGQIVWPHYFIGENAEERERHVAVQ